MAFRTYGPWEPPEFRLYRHQYYRRRHWRQAVEARIGMSDAGLMWLRQVQRIGH